MSYLFNNILHFTRFLRAAGVEVHAARMPDIATALDCIDIARPADFYFTLRTLLVHRRQDLAEFDAAFQAFWRGMDRKWNSVAPFPRARKSTHVPEFRSASAKAGDDASVCTLSETAVRTAAMSYSRHEVSRTKDFAEFSVEEMRQAQNLLMALRWTPGMRQTRRWAPRAGRTPDLSRIVRTNMRYGGEPIRIPVRRRKQQRRPLVLLCDISGSMEKYSRMLLHFAHTLAAKMDRTEAFLFSTRLTRVTRDLSKRSADEAVSGITANVTDWSGGTRIGEALGTFNRVWARRTLGHGAVVLIVSDGWDRGDPDTLRAEISRLRRTCHRLIWLNPLLGSPGYEPLTRGMRAARPYIDDFLPVHNLESLEALAEHLNALPPRPRSTNT
jgi:uncharacterized protein with von Willebrand factor type A (vWA) domain